MPYLGNPYTSSSGPTTTKSLSGPELSRAVEAYSEWRDTQPHLNVHSYSTDAEGGSFTPPGAGTTPGYSYNEDNTDVPFVCNQPGDDSMNGRARSHEAVHGEPHPIQAFKTSTGPKSNVSFQTRQSSFPPALSEAPTNDTLRRVLERSKALEAGITSLKTDLQDSDLQNLSNSLHNLHLIETNQDTNSHNHIDIQGRLSVIGHVYETRFQELMEMSKSQQKKIEWLTSRVQELTADNDEFERDLSKAEDDIQALKSKACVIREDNASRVYASAGLKPYAPRVDVSDASTAFRDFPLEVSGRVTSDPTESVQSRNGANSQGTRKNPQRSYPVQASGWDQRSRASQAPTAYQDRSAYRGPAKQGSMASKGPSDYPVSSQHMSTTRPGQSFARSLDVQRDDDQSDQGSFVRERSAGTDDWYDQLTYEDLIYDGP